MLEHLVLYGEEIKVLNTVRYSSVLMKRSHALPFLNSTPGADSAKHLIIKFRSNSSLCFPT